MYIYIYIFTPFSVHPNELLKSLYKQISGFFFLLVTSQRINSNRRGKKAPWFSPQQIGRWLRKTDAKVIQDLYDIVYFLVMNILISLLYLFVFSLHFSHRLVTIFCFLRPGDFFAWCFMLISRWTTLSRDQPLLQRRSIGSLEMACWRMWYWDEVRWW